MPSLKEVRLRIASVNSTKQITSAMKMVAASKLRRAQDSILKMRPYAAKLKEILQGVTVSMEQQDENIYAAKRHGGKVLIIPISSNRGLCGAFNANVIKASVRLINEQFAAEKQGGRVHLMTIGRKASEYFRRQGFEVISSHDEIFDGLNFGRSSELAESIMNAFANAKYDKVILVYNHFRNAASQYVQAEQFLPVEPPATDSGKTQNFDYIFEPGKEDIVNELIPRSLKIQFYKSLLDSFASEHGARMTAMHQATDNAQELLKDLRLSYNKARQAAITKEILEIVSGAEALKG
jgi:F-type H+-transporting ATPase subunit gamma